MTIKEKIVQKLAGLAFIAISITSIIIANDGTIALLFIPLGLYALFTKKQIIF